MVEGFCFLLVIILGLVVWLDNWLDNRPDPLDDEEET